MKALEKENEEKKR